MAKKFPQDELILNIKDTDSQNTNPALIPANDDEFTNEDDGYFSEEEFFLEEELIEAAKNGNVEDVEDIINEGANIEHFDEIGNTALMYAAIYGHLEVVKLLIIAGADINATSIGNPELVLEGADYAFSGKTAANYAHITNHEDIAAYINNYATDDLNLLGE